MVSLARTISISAEAESLYSRRGSRFISKPREARSAATIAAKVAEEDTRKAFICRVRLRKVWNRAFAAYTAAPPWRWS